LKNMVKVIIHAPEKKDMEIKGMKKIDEIMNKLGLKINAHIVLKNGKPVPEDDEIKDDDTIEIIQVFSGG